MKIDRVSTIRVRVPVDRGGAAIGWGGSTWSHLDTLLVRIDTDAGVTGWGEAFGYNAIPASRAALDKMIGPLLIGKDPTQINQVMHEMQVQMHLFGRYGATMFALSGVDLALWDIAGKLANLPLSRLLGGARRTELFAYASLFKYNDAKTVAALSEKALGEGYTMLKLHEFTVEPVVAARQVAGDAIPITLDVNCAWTPVQGLEMAERLKPYNLTWLEEPVWPPENHAGLKAIRDAGTPTAAGENWCTAWEFRNMMDACAVTFVQPSMTKVGGVSEFRKVVALAESRNIRLAPHSPYFGPGFLATLQMVSTLGPDVPVERFYCRLDGSLYGDLVVPKDGKYLLPEGPGLGRDPDMDYIRSHTVEE
jgi:L-alanine-DL-glutamate epimerase-like enolase superfamily enzyme